MKDERVRSAEISIGRRELIKAGFGGLCVIGLNELILRADAEPTESSGSVGEYARYLQTPVRQDREKHKVLADASIPLAPTEDNILGPFYRAGAPFRAKISPPLEPGKVVVVKGRIWGYDSKKPLSNTVIDIWHASANGRYDNDDQSKPPRPDVFTNRARLHTNEQGYYEFETVHPGAYQIGPNAWRPSHIHYMVQSPSYKTLVTQLYFAGDTHNKTDQFIKQSLIRSFADVRVGEQSYEAAVFDIVLVRS